MKPPPDDPEAQALRIALKRLNWALTGVRDGNMTLSEFAALAQRTAGEGE